MASQTFHHKIVSPCHGSSSSKHDRDPPEQQQLQQLACQFLDHDPIPSDDLADAHDASSDTYDVVADIKLPHELQLQQPKELESEACSAGTGSCSYVGVDKVPGRSRWPYRAVLSLPAWVTRDSCHDTLLCESYYSTAEAAARAVDAICIVLLGRQAAVNFPASAYNATDLEDALQYVRCISGGAFTGSCGCAGVSKVGLGSPAVTAAAVLLGATVILDSSRGTGAEVDV